MEVFPKERLGLIMNLVKVPGEKVRAALEDLTIIECDINASSIVKGTPNPAVYIGVTINCTEKKPLLVKSAVNVNTSMVNKQYGEGVAPTVTPGKTIMVDMFNKYAANAYFYYGIVLHEMAHAWAERCTKEESTLPLKMAFGNSEQNAWLFEIQWVCDLANNSSHAYGAEMRENLIRYFNEAGGRYDQRAKDHVKWSLERIGLSERVRELDSKIFT